MRSRKYSFQKSYQSISNLCIAGRTRTRVSNLTRITDARRCRSDRDSKCRKILAHQYLLCYQSKDCRISFYDLTTKYRYLRYRRYYFFYGRYSWCSRRSICRKMTWERISSSYPQSKNICTRSRYG